MVLEQRGEYATIREAIHSIAPKIGCCADTLRVWVKRHQQGLINTSISNNASPLTSDERQRLKELERENRELRRSNDILRQASAYFRRRSSTATGKNDAIPGDAEQQIRGRASMP